jgi:hypothetical protein
MAARNYYQTILDTLQGRTDQLRTIPPERLDWAGPGAFLELYRQTSGGERSALIQAIGQVIQDHPAPPAVLAQLIEIAFSLDLAEVEPQVLQLQAEPIAAQEPLRGAITNFLAYRRLNTSAQTVPPSWASKDRPGTGQARPIRNVKGHTGTG